MKVESMYINNIITIFSTLGSIIVRISNVPDYVSLDIFGD